MWEFYYVAAIKRPRKKTSEQQEATGNNLRRVKNEKMMKKIKTSEFDQKFDDNEDS
jgi:hypothetical protein